MKWKEYSLDELIHIKHGYAFKGEFFSEEPTDDILLTPGNFAIGGGFKAQKLKYYNGEFPVDYILDENDVIVTMTDLSKEADTLGFSAKVPAWYGKRFLHNQRIGLVKLKTDDFDKDYLYWLMRTFSYQRFVANGATGATVKHTSPTKICQYKFIAPDDKTTQRKIASILSAYDDLIENNLKRIKLMEEKLMIEYSLLEEDSKNLKEFDFSNFVSFVKGIEPGSSNYLSEKSDGTLPFIRVGDLSKRDSDIFVEESKTKGIISNPNDVLISMDGTIGIVRYGIYGCYSSGIRKAVSNGVLNNAFIFCYLSSKKIQGVIYSHSKGSTIQHAGSSISHFKVKLPKETSLNNFIKFSNPIFDMMNNLLKQNTKLREARDILLPKLMSGQIEV